MFDNTKSVRAIMVAFKARLLASAPVTPPVDDGSVPVAAGSLFESKFGEISAPVGTRLADALPSQWKRTFRKGIDPASYNPAWSQPKLTNRGTVVVEGDVVPEWTRTFHSLPEGGSCQYEFGYQPTNTDDTRPSCLMLMSDDGLNGVIYGCIWSQRRNFAATEAQMTEAVRVVSTLHVIQNGDISPVPGAGGDTGLDQPFVLKNAEAIHRFEYDHVTKVLKVTGNAGGGWSWDLSAYNLPGRGIGFGGTLYNMTPNIEYTGVRFSNSIGRIQVTAQALKVSAQTFTASLVYDGKKPTKIQHRTLDVTTKVPFGDWTTGTAVITGPADGHGTIEYSATVPTGRSAVMEYRMFNDTTVVARANNSTTFNFVAVPTVFGANVRSNNYYTAPPMLNNWAKFVYGGGESVPTSRLYLPYMGIKGLNTLRTNPGVSINNITSPKGGSGGNTVGLVSTNSTTGVHVINVVDDQNVADFNSAHRYIDWSGTVTSLVVERDGKTDEFSDEWLAMLAPLTGMRDLDAVGTSFTGGNPDNVMTRNLDTDAGWPSGGFSGALVPFPVMCRMVKKLRERNSNFKVYWHTIGIDMPMTQIRAEAEAAFATIPTDVKIVLEYGNELPWNFGGNSVPALFEGLYAGYLDGYTHDNPAPANLRPKKPIKSGPGQQFANAANSTLPELKAGDAVYCDMSGGGDVFYKVLKDAPAGTPISDTSVFFFEPLWNAQQNGRVPARRWLIQRSLQVFKIWKEVFGASFDTRCAPCRMGQYGNSFTSGYQGDEMAYLPEYTGMLKGIGHATYLYPAPGTDTGSGTWDVAAIEAAFMAGIPDCIQKIRAMYRDAEILGIPQVMVYEGVNTHRVGGNASFDAAYTAFQRSDAKRRVIKAFVIAHRQEFSNAIVMQYDLFGGGREWSRFQDPGDMAAPGLLGWNEGFAASL